jgi:adenylosuccinate synthase
MNSKAVIGLGLGDCGKGIVTDYLCSITESPLVGRFSGGHQAGHTVVYEGVRHVFSNFGSGTLRGVPTFWAKYCTVEPIGLFNEYDLLLMKNIIPKLFISIKCPITTPYEIHENRRDESILEHGSCGVGVGATIAREEAHYSLTFGDLFYPSVVAIKLSNIQKYYGFNLNLDRFYEAVNRLMNHPQIIPVDRFPTNYENIIWEGSQGLLLDQHIGFFPHVTRGFTGTTNIKDTRPDLFLITRAYQTRHGNGPMTNESLPHNIKLDPLETNVEHEYQGKFRRSLLDLDLLLYGMSKDDYIRQNTNKKLVITCLDHVTGDYRFTYKGSIAHCLHKDEFIARVSAILGIDTVYVSETNESKNIYKWER